MNKVEDLDKSALKDKSMETDRDDEVAIENIVPVLQEEVIVEKKSQDNEFDEQMLRIINNSKILEAGEKEKM